MIDRDALRELLHYEPDTGVLTWKPRGRGMFPSDRSWKMWNTRYAGKRAGSVKVNASGYVCRRIKVAGRDLYEHRVAFMLNSDRPMPDEIDHKNRDATDNRWENLQESSRSENSRNVSMRADNTSGVTGVHWRQSEAKWSACCMLKGARHYLGLFSGLDEAAMEVLEFRAEHGFSPSHGLEVAKYHTALQSTV